MSSILLNEAKAFSLAQKLENEKSGLLNVETEENLDDDDICWQIAGAAVLFQLLLFQYFVM